VRAAGTVYIFVDGSLLGSGSAAGDISGLTDGISIGGTTAASQYADAYFDEIRISNIARHTAAFTVKTAEYNIPVQSGNLTSANLQINASGQASLGAITWQESVPSNTDIQFTTRTGTTNDTVYYNGWASWVSSSTVVDTVTSPTAWSATGTITPSAPSSAQARNILFYETDDNVSPNTIQFAVSGAVSTNAYCSETIPLKDLSSYKFIGFWLKSPVTGSSVKIGIGETNHDELYITANTVSANTWEYHYWPLTYTSTQKDNIKNVRLTYLGDGTGNIFLGEIYAYDFLDSGETISSNPNDWIQYKAILGSNVYSDTPKLIQANSYVVSLSYSSSGGISEDSLTSYWQSKIFDMNQPMYNKKLNFVELTAKTQNPTTGNTCYLDYECDEGLKSGTLSATFPVTGNATKLRFYFPSGTYGKNFWVKIRDTDVDSNITVYNCVVDYHMEANS
jgi:hypothetical protein